MKKIIEFIGEHPSQEPSYLPIDQLVDWIKNDEGDAESVEFLKGVLAVKIYGEALDSVSKTRELITELGDLEPMLKGVIHARLMLHNQLVGE